VHPDLLAHVKWFTDPAKHPTDWSLLASWPVLAAFAFALAATGVAFVIQHRLRDPKVLRTFERFAEIAPTVLGVLVGLALLVSALLGILFSPNLHPSDEPIGRAILVVEGLCGLMLLLGVGTRAAAILLALLGIVAMQPFSLESILENAQFLGIAIFLFIVGRGPFSLDRLRGLKPPVRHKDAPLWAGWAAAGTGLVAVAAWLPFLTVQDFWRWVGFLAGRPERDPHHHGALAGVEPGPRQHLVVRAQSHRDAVPGDAVGEV